MPMHDWTRVEAGILHAFHVAWTPVIQGTFNGGLLPEGPYALAEQHAGRSIADVLRPGPASAGVHSYRRQQRIGEPLRQ